MYETTSDNNLRGDELISIEEEDDGISRLYPVLSETYAQAVHVKCLHLTAYKYKEIFLTVEQIVYTDYKMLKISKKVCFSLNNPIAAFGSNLVMLWWLPLITWKKVPLFEIYSLFLQASTWKFDVGSPGWLSCMAPLSSGDFDVKGAFEIIVDWWVHFCADREAEIPVWDRGGKCDLAEAGSKHFDGQALQKYVVSGDTKISVHYTEAFLVYYAVQLEGAEAKNYLDDTVLSDYILTKILVTHNRYVRFVKLFMDNRDLLVLLKKLSSGGLGEIDYAAFTLTVRWFIFSGWSGFVSGGGCVI